MIGDINALSISCPEVISPGEEFIVRVEDDSYNGIKAKFNFSNNFIYQDILVNTPWKVHYDGVKGVVVGNVTNSDNLNMEIKVKANMDLELNKEYTLGLIDIEGNNNKYKSTDQDDLSCGIRVVSDINTLDSLVVDNVNLSPKFDKNVTVYKGITNSDSINIKVSASDKSATIDGDIGKKSLSVGVNAFVIKVTSPRGNKREYKLYITREVDKKSSDITLKSLKLSSGKIEFDKNKFLYMVDVDYDIDKIDIEVIPNDSKARVEINKNDLLVVGENTINVKVIAEDGTSGTYVVVVNRKNKPSSDATIKSLTIKNYDINFKSSINDYKLQIDNEDKLDVNVILNSDKAHYVINGNKDLINGSVIEIVVTSEDDTKNIYKIKIKKASVNNSREINNYLKVVPIVGFIILIILVLVLKLSKSRFIKNKKNPYID